MSDKEGLVYITPTRVFMNIGVQDIGRNHI